MTNSSLPTNSSSTPNAQIQGITEIRQKTIAALIARGFSVKYVAKKLKISESRIYHLFSEKNSIVNDEIYRILNDAFAASDYRLINLYDKALQKLDAMLSSPDEEKQCRAIDRIIKMFFARSSKNGVTIQQYFGIESQEEKETMDQFILRRAKERALKKHEEEEEEEEEEVTSSP
jgi:plasmid maintenance system antidote protein VapI